MRVTRPPSLPVWVWAILIAWGPCVMLATAASGYRPRVETRFAALMAAILSALAYLAALALRRLLAGAAAAAGQPYVVRHAGLAFGATMGALQVAGHVPVIGSAPFAQFGAALLLHATIGAPFALWGGALWQASMRWFFRGNSSGRD
jgi:hypothetical protein